MNKSEFVQELSSRTGLTKADSASVVDSLFDPDAGIISRQLQNGSKVQITGFGTFEPRHRKARKGRNPQTGETIQIAASVNPAFRAGKGLKEAL